MKEKLTEAFNAKNNDVNSFVWKLARKSDHSQDTIKLMDATPEQLNQFYNHCYAMLHNTDKSNPGRYPLLNMIKEQRNKCNVELYLRKLENGSITNGESYPRYLYCQDLLSCISKNRESFPQAELDNIPISAITGGLPKEFDRLSIKSVIDGCMGRAGYFNSKHITFTFLIKMGLFLTPEEMKEFTETDEYGKLRSKIELVKERLKINPKVGIEIKPNGLSFSELRAMLNIRHRKYEDLTTEQLMTLRNKVLFRLEQYVNLHIEQWERRMGQIKKVAEVRNITLKGC